MLSLRHLGAQAGAASDSERCPASPRLPMQSHYDTLGLERGATDAEVKARYRKLALKLHPDKPGGDGDQFKALTEAYEMVMKDRGKSAAFELWSVEDFDELTGKKDAMRKACLSGNVLEVQRLLDAGADVNVADHFGLTALKYACVNDHDLCAELLISRNAEVDQMSAAGVTALMEACTMGREACVRVLLEYGAVVDHENRHGQTALMFAAVRGHKACVHLLCTYGACKAAADYQGKTAAAFARSCHHSSVARWLEMSFLRGLSRTASPRASPRASPLASRSTSRHASRNASHNASRNASRNSSLRGGSAWEATQEDSPSLVNLAEVDSSAAGSAPREPSEPSEPILGKSERSEPRQRDDRLPSAQGGGGNNEAPARSAVPPTPAALQAAERHLPPSVVPFYAALEAAISCRLLTPVGAPERAWTLVCHPAVGRHLIASRDLARGEMVFSEARLLIVR